MHRTIATPPGEPEIHEKLDKDEVAKLSAEQAVAKQETKRREVLAEIAALEAQITPRRLLEALSGDQKFLPELKGKIDKLRARLPASKS